MTELRPLKLSSHGQLSRPELEPLGASQEEGQRASFLSLTAGTSQHPLVPYGSQPSPGSAVLAQARLCWKQLEASSAAPSKATTRSAPVWAAHRIARPGPSCPLLQPPPGPQQPGPHCPESPPHATHPCAFPLPGYGERSPASNPTVGTRRELGCSCAPYPGVLPSRWDEGRQGDGGNRRGELGKGYGGWGR